MKKKQFPIGFTDEQMKHLKEASGDEAIAAYVRKLVNEDMKKKK